MPGKGESPSRAAWEMDEEFFLHQECQKRCVGFGEAPFVSSLAFLWRVSSKLSSQRRDFFVVVVGLFSVCDIKKSATLAGFLHKENIRGRWMFPAFFFSDLKGNQSNLASDKISSTSFNREAFRKSSALIINNSSLHFNSPHRPGQTK